MTRLARRLGFFALVVYGIGDILGAGIYALVGKVIGIAGSGAWLTFFLAALAALLTGVSYAELSSRYPVAGGAASYVRRAFPGRAAATMIGVFILGTGLTSAATVSSAFSGYLNKIIAVPDALAKFTLVSLMSFLSFWGIQESSRVNMVFTAVEILGLMAVIAAGFQLVDAPSAVAFARRAVEDIDFGTALAGVTLAFYAYIGFEDLANLAEEAKNPARDLPRAILIAIGTSTLVYLLVTLALQVNVPEAEIAASETPLLLIFQKAGYHWILNSFSVVAIVAISNTGLINLIMASRLMYGMSNEGLLPRGLSQIHHRRQTPWVGVAVAWLAVLALVFSGGVKILAQTTSLLILTVFLLVHVSLIRVKSRREPHSGFRFHALAPIAGGLLCLVLIVQFPQEAFLRAGALLGIGALIWALQGLSRRSSR